MNPYNDNQSRVKSGQTHSVTQLVLDRLIVRLMLLCTDEKRLKDLKFLSDGLNSVLQGRCFPVMSGASNVCLPDETFYVLGLLYKSQSIDWYVRLQEKLKSSRQDSINRNSFDKTGFEAFSEISFKHKHSYSSKVSDFVTLEVTSDLSGMQYSISFNDQNIAYRTAVFEDINKIVGRDNLLKRSLVLIKAWCLYELPRYLKIPSSVLKRTINPDTIAVMVINVFATKDTRSVATVLTNPLDVLLYFLSEFSSLAWDKWAVTACGLVSKAEVLSADSMPVISKLVAGENQSANGNCMGKSFADVIHKYRHLLRSDGPDNLTMSLAATGASNQAVSDGSKFIAVPPDPPMSDPFLGETELFDELKTQLTETNACMYIFDTLVPMLNLSQCSQYSRCMGSSEPLELGDLLPAALKLGLQDLMVNITTAENCNETNQVYSIDSINRYSQIFPNIANVITNYIGEYKEILVSENLTRFYRLFDKPKKSIVDMITDVDLIVHSKVTGEAIAHIIVHILQREGKSQTIGEIGKMLQEVIGNPNLTRIIKTSFRGLKRLISLFPALLRLGEEHSFNPHVYLLPGASTTGTAMSFPDSSSNRNSSRSTTTSSRGSGSGSRTKSDTSSRSEVVSLRESEPEVDNDVASCDDAESLTDGFMTAEDGAELEYTHYDSQSASRVDLTSSQPLPPFFEDNTASFFPHMSMCASEIDDFQTQSLNPTAQPFSLPYAHQRLDMPSDDISKRYSVRDIDALEYNISNTSYNTFQSHIDAPVFTPAGVSPVLQSSILFNPDLEASSSSSSSPYVYKSGMSTTDASPVSAAAKASSHLSMSGTKLPINLTASTKSRNRSMPSLTNSASPNQSPVHSTPARASSMTSAATVPLAVPIGPNKFKLSKKDPASSSVKTIALAPPEPLPSSPPQVGFITSASGATIVDPHTGTKIFNPVRPEVWVPGKFSHAQQESMKASLSSLRLSVDTGPGSNSNNSFYSGSPSSPVSGMMTALDSTASVDTGPFSFTQIPLFHNNAQGGNASSMHAHAHQLMMYGNAAMQDPMLMSMPMLPRRDIMAYPGLQQSPYLGVGDSLEPYPSSTDGGGGVFSMNSSFPIDNSHVLGNGNELGGDILADFNIGNNNSNNINSNNNNNNNNNSVKADDRAWLPNFLRDL